MKSTEAKEQRVKRVEMHQYFIDKVDAAMKSGDYIAASWLIYSCLENRYFRTLEKYKASCKYCRSRSRCNNKPKNKLALATKIKCVQRLHENGASCIAESFRYDLFHETIRWIEQRNELMHELLSLEYYEDTDERFKESAEIGKRILDETYQSCTAFRAAFYQPDYKFHFPQAAMEGCSCRPKGE